MTRYLAFLLIAAASPAAAQGRADGLYPATLLCEGMPSLRVTFTVEIAGGQARYTAPVPGGSETGSGTLSGRSLVLTGRSRRWEARYSGTVDGLGGLLTGRQTGPGLSRACQLSLGGGRG